MNLLLIQEVHIQHERRKEHKKTVFPARVRLQTRLQTNKTRRLRMKMTLSRQKNAETSAFSGKTEAKTNFWWNKTTIQPQITIIFVKEGKIHNFKLQHFNRPPHSLNNSTSLNLYTFGLRALSRTPKYEPYSPVLSSPHVPNFHHVSIK